MKDYIKQLIEDVQDDWLGRSMVREYLQAKVLQMLQDCGVFRNWVFHGGTSLRFLYSIPRYSEDLDFALVEPRPRDEFVTSLKKVKNAFETEGYRIETKLKTGKNVKMAMVGFQGLLFDLGLSPHAGQVLSVKIELDTNPPAGGGFETSVIRRFVPIHLQHYDKPSLLSGKLHAILARPYTKGRDVYDLVWYLADRSWPGPNLIFLNNALTQTGWAGPKISEGNWKSHVAEKFYNIDWNTVRKDVQAFLERKSDVELLTEKNVMGLLKSTP